MYINTQKSTRIPSTHIHASALAHKLETTYSTWHALGDRLRLNAPLVSIILSHPHGENRLRRTLCFSSELRTPTQANNMTSFNNPITFRLFRPLSYRPNPQWSMEIWLQPHKAASGIKTCSLQYPFGVLACNPLVLPTKRHTERSICFLWVVFDEQANVGMQT